MHNSFIDKTGGGKIYTLDIIKFAIVFFSVETHQLIDKYKTLYKTIVALHILSICRIRILGGWQRE